MRDLVQNALLSTEAAAVKFKQEQVRKQEMEVKYWPKKVFEFKPYSKIKFELKLKNVKCQPKCQKLNSL